MKILENPTKLKTAPNLLLLFMKITKFLEFSKKITIKTIVFSNSVPSHLYSCLLDANGSDGTLTDAAQILERVVPQAPPPPLSGPPAGNLLQTTTGLPHMTDQEIVYFFSL